LSEQTIININQASTLIPVNTMLGKYEDDKLATYRVVPYTQNRRKFATKFRRFLSVAFILCIALSLSTFVHHPWSSLRFNDVLEKVKDGTDPADSWKDNIWPFRPQTPWDISTDFRYPRAIEYNVTEGTWLRLDVHPKTGDIIFDILGDIYCLPGSAYLQGISETISRKAHPVLLGVPHDSDPHFSPNGKMFAFRSDAGLGLENIWVTKWTECEDMDVRPTERMSAELEDSLKHQNVDEDLLARGMKETPERRERRLLREGRFYGT
jgi:hypothetical protein